MLLVYGEETPPKSRAEMDALGAVPGIQIARLRRGKFAIHEEFAEQVAREITIFLSGETRLGTLSR
jgi:hypothetical protein